MKHIFFTSLLLLLTIVSFGQQTKDVTDNFIDKYLKSYTDRTKSSSTMGEKMIKRSIELGLYKNEGFVRVMKQVKTFKTVRLSISATEGKKIMEDVGAKAEKDHLYDEYYSSDYDGKSSYIIYTRGGKIVKELVVIEISNYLSVTCYIGDHIDLDAIRQMTLGQ